MIVVAGAAGQLGSAFRSTYPQAAFLSRAELDLARPETIAPVLDQYRPDVIINCAAYTKVDQAEDDEELAYLVNALAVGEMASYAAAKAIPFVTYSTDYVFDGSSDEPYLESDETAPINAYGRTKLAGERLALAAHPSPLIIRTSWVISGTHPNFIATILRLAPERELKIVDDQWGNPTITTDLARATRDALDAGATGVVHITNQGSTTWYELARAAVGLAGGDVARITACSTQEYPTRAIRPAFSVLESDRALRLGIPPLPPWQDSLAEVVRQQLVRLAGAP